MTADVLEAAPPTRPTRTADRGRRRLPRLAGLAGAGIAGAGIAAVAITMAVTGGRDGNQGGIDQGGYAPQVDIGHVGQVGPGAPVSLDEAAPSATRAAPTPLEAVTRFLEAEIARDVATSYGQLSAADRIGFGSEEGWEAIHDQLPTYESYTVVTTDDDQVEVDVVITPEVNEVVGVIPGAAHVRFVVSAEDGGYRVDLAETRFTPVYPADAGATVAATTWVGARQRCGTGGTGGTGEFGGSLIGELQLAERLCGITGTPTATATGHLDTLADPTFVLSAFGGDAVDWARVVTVSGLDGVAPIHVVLAPLGDVWVVIGAAAAS